MAPSTDTDADTTMKDTPPDASTKEDPPAADTSTPNKAPNNKQKRKAKSAQAPTKLTLRRPPWTYLHLTLHVSSAPTSPEPLDALTTRTRLTSALSQFLGLTGSAIPIDILKLDGQDVWIRVPREDGGAVVAAVSGWVGGDEKRRVGWRVRGRDEWVGRLVGGRGEDLFGG